MERDGQALPTSPCIKCESFDGFPCPMNGKADAQVMTVDPAKIGTQSRSGQS